jgi:hypothetical protein
MTQTEKARDEETDQPELEANEQTQTPFSRQAGFNQPLPHDEDAGNAASEQKTNSILEVKPINPT